MMTKFNKKDEEGFTLIELLVVILIIGILSAIAIPAFLSQRSKAWQANAVSTARNAALIIEAYKAGHGGDLPDAGGNATDTPAGLSDKEQQEWENLLKADTTKLEYKAGTDGKFVVCGQDTRLGTESTDLSYAVYDSNNGGIKKEMEAACPDAS